jgi:hypothetical protein
VSHLFEAGVRRKVFALLLIQPMSRQGEILSESSLTVQWQKGRPRARSKQQNTLETPKRFVLSLSAALVYQQPLFAISHLELRSPSKSSIHFVSRPAAAAALVALAHKRMRRRRLLGNYLIANALSGGSSCIVCWSFRKQMMLCVALKRIVLNPSARSNVGRVLLSS